MNTEIRFTHEENEKLSKTDYFERPESPAAVAIMPFVQPHHVGVEIGVFMGTSSEVFLRHCAFMYFIDPCFPYEGNPDSTVYATEDMFRKKMKWAEGRFKFIKGMSADVADQVPEVDFVFIDGNHMYEWVKKDIDLYWPKVKSGGFLSGHDYSQWHVGVRRAVDEFAAAVGLPLEVHHYCWRIAKP